MKRDTLRLSQHQFIETSRDFNGRFFIAYSGGASVFIRETKELRRFLKIPKSIPMRETLESWLVSLEDMDAKRKAPAQEAPSEPDRGSEDPQIHVAARDLPSAATQHKKGYAVEPLTSEASIQQTSSSLSQELLATGFGPECHEEDDDPTANTRMIT